MLQCSAVLPGLTDAQPLKSPSGAPDFFRIVLLVTLLCATIEHGPLVVRVGNGEDLLVLRAIAHFRAPHLPG
jgi:hypothetical protein